MYWAAHDIFHGGIFLVYSQVFIGFLPSGHSFTGVVNCDNWRAPTGDKEERKEMKVKDLDEGNGRVMRAIYLLNSPDNEK